MSINPNMVFSLPSFLTVGSTLFAAGLFVVMTRRNMVAILMGIELILNGAALNFASFAFFQGMDGGMVMVLFIMALAALEAVVALSIILSIYRMYRTTSIDRATSMRD